MSSDGCGLHCVNFPVNQQVQEYVRLLSTWCDWNCHSRQFILGSALLHMGEPDKASDWMIKAAAGISAQSDQGRSLVRVVFSYGSICNKRAMAL